MKADRQHEYKVAKTLEKKGQVDAAVAVYLRYSDIDEASRALVACGRFADAGDVLLNSLNVRDGELDTLNDRERRIAAKAAVCYAKAGDTRRSVDIYVGIGDVVQATRVLEQAGDFTGASRLRAQHDSQRKPSSSQDGPVSAEAPNVLELKGDLVSAMKASIQLRDYGSAARLAYKLGKPADAAQLCLQAGMFYEAGMSFKAAGDLQKAIEALCRVDKGGPRYRAAAVQGVAISVELRTLEYEFDHFITQFVGSAPQDAKEAAAMYALGKLYQKGHLPDSALDVFKKVQAFDPRYRDVSALVVELAKQAHGSEMSFRHIIEEDARFRAASDEHRDRAPAPRESDEESKLPSLPPLDGPESEAGSPHTRLGGFEQAEAPEGVVMPGTVVSPGTTPPDRRPPPTVDPRLTVLTEGTIISDRYEIKKELGRGGMAAVYQAYDGELDEMIALKFFFAGEATPELVKRFKQELTLSRKLAHPNIVGVYDIGTHGGCKFMSMELLKGVTLTDRIASGLEVVDGLGYLAQACAGLHVAHSQNIVHRDVKPDNLFITESGVLKIMDFGIAKHQTGPAMTRAGFMAGTPEYIAPEQINNFGKVTHLADIYAIGVVAYEIVTGTVPFAHEDLMPLLQMHMIEPPEPPSRRSEGVPLPLEQAILKCLAKKPENRVSSCAELAEIFSAFQKELR